MRRAFQQRCGALLKVAGSSSPSVSVDVACPCSSSNSNTSNGVGYNNEPTPTHVAAVAAVSDSSAICGSCSSSGHCTSSVPAGPSPPRLFAAAPTSSFSSSSHCQTTIRSYSTFGGQTKVKLQQKQAAAVDTPSSSSSPSPLSSPPSASSATAAAAAGSASAPAQSLWESALPPPSDPRWEAVGRAVVQQALDIDTGAEAFAEVLEARRQLEVIVQACGYDLSVYAFGGFAVMGLLEVGGDVDFTAVADVEPEFEEASEIISRLSREMRRLGIRCTALPRARVPVVKVDRASHALPGSPLHSNSSCGVFQFSRPLLSEEQRAFDEALAEQYHAVRCEWDAEGRTATVKFPDTSSLLVGLTHVRRFGSVEIPIRVPLDARQGPELYRFPFDFCLSSTGLHNSHLLGEYLRMYPYGRHIALALKKWGRSSGVVNSMEGLLASYALTVMLVHFLALMGELPLVETNRIASEPHQLPKEIEYHPLATAAEGDMARVGYLFAAFFEYYGKVFDYDSQVVCTTNVALPKSSLGWEVGCPSLVTSGVERPPFYYFAIKDPFGHENIARNLGKEAAQYVKQANALVADYIAKDLEDPKFLVSSISEHGPRPVFDPVNGTYNPKYLNPSSQETTEAFRKLKKMEFHRRRDNLQRFGQNTMRQHSQVKVAQDVTRNMLSWLKSDK